MLESLNQEMLSIDSSNYSLILILLDNSFKFDFYHWTLILQLTQQQERQQWQQVIKDDEHSHFVYIILLVTIVRTI